MKVEPLLFELQNIHDLQRHIQIRREKADRKTTRADELHGIAGDIMFSKLAMLNPGERDSFNGHRQPIEIVSLASQKSEVCSRMNDESRWPRHSDRLLPFLENPSQFGGGDYVSRFHLSHILAQSFEIFGIVEFFQEPQVEHKVGPFFVRQSLQTVADFGVGHGSSVPSTAGLSNSF